MLRSLSDIITFSRLCFTPLIVIFALLPLENTKYLAWYCFIIAALSDVVDGYIARKFKTTSKFGSIFDSYADKVLTIIMLFLLVVLDKLSILYGIIPAFIITCRELFVFLLRFYAYLKHAHFSVSHLAKIKTFLQMSGICILLYPQNNYLYQIYGVAFLWIGSVFALISGFQYFLFFIKKTKNNTLTDNDIDML